MVKSKNPLWVIVLRNTKTGKTFIWETENGATDLLYRAHKYFVSIVRNNDWSREADDYIRERYPFVGAVPLVIPISKLLGRRVSPNAIRGRYWRIKKIGPDEIRYCDPDPGEGPHLTLEGPSNARSN